MAQTIVSFENGQLVSAGFSLPAVDKLRVVSMIGKGRRGKSTFLNAIVSLLSVKNESPFQTSDGDDHCTKSVDAYVIPQLNLMLLDSRGLATLDSQNDEKLLLFLHQVSDMIIYNERTRLDNTCLKLLEGLCTFTPDLDEDLRKPKLFFRVADCEIKDVSKAIGDLLAPCEDQYQSIRYSIQHLFDEDIQIIPTETPDRNARTALNAGQYLDVIQTEEDPYKFAAAIKDILNNLPTPSDSSSFVERMSRVVADINGNPEINVKKLDVVALQADKNIRDWIDSEKNVPKSSYADIPTDGSQKSYDENIQTRKNQKKSILTDFTRKWKAVAKELRDPHYQKLSTDLGAPIEKAVKECEKKARQRIATVLKEAEADRNLSEINNQSNSFTTLPDTFFIGYLRVYDNLRQACKGLYDVVREEMEEWVDGIFRNVMDTMSSVRAEEAERRAEAELIAESTLARFKENFLDTYNASYELDLTKSNRSFLETYYKTVCDTVLEEFAKILEINSVSFKLVNKKIIHTIHRQKGVFGAHTKKEVASYDLVKPVFEGLSKKLLKIINVPEAENEMFNYMTMRKEEQMRDKIYADSAVVQVILRENPQMEFICDTIANEIFFPATVPHGNTRRYYMTKDTYEKFCFEIYKEGAERLVEKKMCPSVVDCIEASCLVVPHASLANVQDICNTTDNSNRFNTAVKKLWKIQIYKVFCRKMMDGLVIPEVVTL